LDETCTGEGQGPSCEEPAWVPEANYHDGVDGIDNAIGLVFKDYYPGLADTLTAMGTDAGIDEEEIFRVRGYSGHPNDDHVEVDLYTGLGIEPRDDGGTDPLWDGNDRWQIFQDVLRPPSHIVDEPLYVDSDAYVANYVLVAHFTNVVVPTYLPLAPDSLYPVAQLVLKGTLTYDGSQWAVQDLVAATRVKVSDFLSSSARLPNLSDSSHPLCETFSLYQQLQQRVCSFEDISSTLNSGPSPCDALSGAVIMQAKQAQLGRVRPAAGPLPPCDPRVPEVDTCQPLSGP
jgi:hypothetical protein